jgi:two-component system, OmpR family, phosphate regulon sensor histidine kinase PhoR
MRGQALRTMGSMRHAGHTESVLIRAVKFSPPGGQVQCSLTQKGPNLLVSVADQGPGISEEDQQHLFEKFRRFRIRAEEQPDGIGLGLAYVKAVASQHHGSVSVVSVPGEGATFTLSLPARGPSPPAAAAGAEPHAGR